MREDFVLFCRVEQPAYILVLKIQYQISMRGLIQLNVNYAL